MKLLLYTVVLFFVSVPVYGQNSDPLPVRETIFFARNGNPDWLVVRKEVQISAARLMENHKADLGLTDQDELRLYRVDTDDLGFSHYRYQQYHQNVKVDGGELLIHEKDGFVRTLNGRLVRGLQLGATPVLSGDEARQKALQHLPAKRYMWEVPAAEATLRRLRNDPAATFYPQPELVLVAPGFTHQPRDFQLAWRVQVYAEQPSVRKDVFISAIDGSVLEEDDLLHDQNTPGTAETKYAGTQPVVADSMSSGLFRLVENTRGNGIETYNMQRQTNHDNAVDFTDDDNYWNNFNAFKDEVATDVHWGAEMTYDYFAQFHNHPGVDGNNMALISYVHYDLNWANASWTGDWARFGDGSGSWNPLTSIDVVSHEFTHGVTDYTADLRYRNESGALNESFSDIFGAAVEFWADPDNSDWLMGEDFHINSGQALRNMANPGQFGDPDTYQGSNWFTGTSNNGGVHTNSGVQNFWFYLLTEGGSGSNDNGDAYTVEGVGLETAAEIAFRNLKYYLVHLSEYDDAREGALQAATDLYGVCSAPYMAAASAWYAVGVGEPLFAYDLKSTGILSPAPLSCGLGDQETISIAFRYTGCNDGLSAGEKIPMAYQIDDNPVVWDTLTLPSDLQAGEVYTFTFTVPAAEFAVPGSYKLHCWTAYGSDENPGNNHITLSLESIAGQNTDVRMQTLDRPETGCFLGAENPRVEIGFWGCDSLPAGTDLTLFYSINGGAPVSEPIKTPYLLRLGDRFKHTFSQAADFSSYGRYTVDAWVRYSPDGINDNDTLFQLQVVHPAAMVQERILAFESGATTLDSIYLTTSSQSQAEMRADAAKSGGFGLRITGGDLNQAFQNATAQVPSSSNVWNSNPDFRTKMCLCADLTNVDNAELQFDLKQTFSFYYLNTFGVHAPYGSTLRVLANGDPIGSTYKAVTPSFDAWKTRKISLADFDGTTVELCFEAHTGISPEFDPNGVGDKVLLDNIVIKGTATTGAFDRPGTEPDWTVMPNPGSGVFTVAFPATEAQEISLEVFDALGRQILARHLAVGPGRQMIPLQLTGQPAGIYTLRLGVERQQYARRIVIR